MTTGNRVKCPKDHAEFAAQSCPIWGVALTNWRHAGNREHQGIPLYDGDLEAGECIPAAVAALKDQIAGAGWGTIRAQLQHFLQEFVDFVKS